MIDIIIIKAIIKLTTPSTGFDTESMTTIKSPKAVVTNQQACSTDFILGGA